MRCLLFALVVAALSAAKAQQPNIVFIISDDAGFADWGFMDSYTSSVNPGQGGSPVPTPNLDLLRSRGVLFTNAYTASVCSPSRAAIMTGSYQQRIGYEFNINNLTNPSGNFEGLRPEDITIFERMKARGYTTGGIGKWHVGGLPDIVTGDVVTKFGNRPPRQGVDEFFGILRGSRNYSVGTQVGDETRALREMSLDANGLEVNVELESAHSGEYVTNTFGQGAVDFIDRHYADTEPFFLYVSFTAPHAPIGPSPDRNEPGVSSDYGSMVYTMDKEIGRIMDKIADPAGDGSVDLTADTLFIFINDNGGASGIGTNKTPLRNWKGSTYEGGIRVPMIFAGAGVGAPPGSVYSEPVHSIDVLATCHELAGGAPLTEIDGVNLLPFVNGTASGQPHKAVVIRSRGKYGIRMGDWKLTRNDGGAPQLFNLSTAIDETDASDVAGANPQIVSQMLEILTEHETGFDKPRFHGLGAAADTINRNDGFRLAPEPPTGGTFTPDLAIIAPGLRNGDFESPPVGGGVDADRNSYAEADFWTNIGTSAQTEALVRANLLRTTPQNAVIPESGSRIAAIDTGHTVATGEVFRLQYWWRDASNWNDANDRIGFTFYTTTDDTVSGPLEESQQFLSEPSTADSTYEPAEAIFTAPASMNGKPLFLSFRGVDGNGSASGFARLDDITLERGTLSNGGGGTAEVLWSAPLAWIDTDTSQSDTLLDLDAFPGAVLEFPVPAGFSYVADNDMTRATGGEFMLNRLVIDGTSATDSQSAEISGLPLLLTPSLSTAPAVIANNALGADFQFTISAPLIPWETLTVEGDGTAGLTVSGSVSDYSTGHPASLTKRGSTTLTLAGNHPFSGYLTVEEGLLALENADLTGTQSVTVDGTITGTGSIASGLAIPGELIIRDGDRIDVTGELDLTGGTLTVPQIPATLPYVIASYGTRTGTFAAVSLPAGHGIDYEYNGNQIALVSAQAYVNWAETVSGLSGADAAFDADANKDGIANGIAFFLGAPNAQVNGRVYLPEINTTGTDAFFSFSRAAAAAPYFFAIRYSTDLQNWTPLASGIEIQANDVTATIPLDPANEGNLFLDLTVTE